MAPLALAGRVVTMDGKFTVHDDGVVYVRDGEIAAVAERAKPAPDGFDGVTPVETGGTIFPGLIELHNHLSYNVLRLWPVPKKFTNRDQWAQGDEYRKLVTGPMKVLANTPRCVQALVRYVEAKCLLGGTTTSQGVKLSSYSGIEHFYRGVVRNVEEPDDPGLPPAGTHIADVEAKDRDKFLAAQKKRKCLLLHLSEGTDERAREHFLALKGEDGSWAITSSLAGIHCVALQAEDFAALAENGGAMVWSPLSNLLLYGGTADVKAAKEAGVRIGIGPDWSPSGSKNVLGELKAARIVNEHLGGVFADRELVALATRNAAGILSWEKTLGSIERGKRADLLVVDGVAGDAYGALLGATESDISLVLVDGVARNGKTKLMRELLGSAEAGKAEKTSAAGGDRLLHFHQQLADPDVGKVPLGEATQLLSDALDRLPELAKELEKKPAIGMIDPPPGEPTVRLVLDHEEDVGVDQRPHLVGPSGEPTAILPPQTIGTPLPQLLVPLELDPVTLADDEAFPTTISHEKNLPKYVKDAMKALA